MIYFASLLLLLNINSAHAGCQTIAMAKADIAKEMPTAIMQELGPLGTQLFLVKFNAFPPVSHRTADLILVADKPDAPRLAVAFFTAGCFVDAAFPERGLFDQIMGKPL